MRIWSTASVEQLRGSFECTTWDVFSQGTGLDKYAETTIDYINFCVDSCVQTKVLTQYPNNKPWFNKKIRRKLLAKDEAYRLKDVNPEEFRLAKSSLKKGIRDAKRSFKLEDRFDTNNPRELWGNINLITQHKGPVKTASTDDATLPSQLNNFYSGFDNANATAPATVPENHNEAPFTISASDVQRKFSRLNEHRAAGPDGIFPRLLKFCSTQLACVFTDIFNLSLLQRKVPLCFKQSVIIPVP